MDIEHGIWISRGQDIDFCDYDISFAVTFHGFVSGLGYDFGGLGDNVGGRSMVLLLIFGMISSKMHSNSSQIRFNEQIR